MSRVLAVSPHLDDAVLCAGHLIARYPGATVVTVFAGWPAADQPLTAWDRAAGFSSSFEAVFERRREDEAALSWLLARPRFLQHLDRQYGAASTEAIMRDLAKVIEDCRPQIVAFPLGLHHPDHITVADAMLRLRDAAATQSIEWIAWADSPYRALPGVLDARLAALGTSRNVSPWLEALPDCGRKSVAVGCYRSQLKALQTDDTLCLDDVWQPEQYWSIGPAERRPEASDSGAETFERAI